MPQNTTRQGNLLRSSDKVHAMKMKTKIPKNEMRFCIAGGIIPALWNLTRAESSPGSFRDRSARPGFPRTHFRWQENQRLDSPGLQSISAGEGERGSTPRIQFPVS